MAGMGRIPMTMMREKTMRDRARSQEQNCEQQRACAELTVLKDPKAPSGEEGKGGRRREEERRLVW